MRLREFCWIRIICVSRRPLAYPQISTINPHIMRNRYNVTIVLMLCFIYFILKFTWKSVNICIIQCRKEPVTRRSAKEDHYFLAAWVGGLFSCVSDFIRNLHYCIFSCWIWGNAPLSVHNQGNITYVLTLIMAEIPIRMEGVIYLLTFLLGLKEKGYGEREWRDWKVCWEEELIE